MFWFVFFSLELEAIENKILLKCFLFYVRFGEWYIYDEESDNKDGDDDEIIL